MVAAGDNLGEQRRRKEPAVPRAAPGGLPQRGALVLAPSHQLLNLLQLDRGDDGAHVHRLVERIADPKRLHSRLELGDQTLRDSFLRQDPRAGAADLALVEPDGIDHAFDHAVQIGVVEDDERRLSAQLERKLLAAAGRRLPDEPADLGRAGEGDLVHVRGD